MLICMGILISNLTEYGNVDILINKPNPISKRLFPAHVREMHRNRDEGFEREFEVRVKELLLLLLAGIHFSISTALVRNVGLSTVLHNLEHS